MSSEISAIIDCLQCLISMTMFGCCRQSEQTSLVTPLTVTSDTSDTNDTNDTNRCCLGFRQTSQQKSIEQSESETKIYFEYI